MTPPQQGSGRELRHGTWCPSLLCLEVADVEILLLMEPISTATTGLQVLVFPSEPLEFLQSPAYHTAWLDSVTRPPPSAHLSSLGSLMRGSCSFQSVFILLLS